MSKLVTLSHCNDVYQARIVPTYLNAHGIYAVVPEWYHATTAWHHTMALQGIRICVIEDERADAMELLSTSFQHDDAKTTSQPIPEASHSHWLKFVAIFLWWCSGIATPFWRCRRHWSKD